MAERKKGPPLTAAPGDMILVGTSGCMPWQWFMAKVLFVIGSEVLTEHTTPSNEIQRQLIPMSQIRAVGSLTALRDYQRRCSEETRQMSNRVSELEAELGRARAAVWSKIDEFMATAWSAAEAYAAEVDPLLEDMRTADAAAAAAGAKLSAAVRRRKAEVTT